jgi:hypothetical protein
VPVEVLAGTVVAHGGPGIGVAGGDLHIAQAHASVKHSGDEGVPSVRRDCVRMTGCGYWCGVATEDSSRPCRLGVLHSKHHDVM